MSQLSGHVRDYLTLRRALGFKLHWEGVILPRFADYLQAAGAETVTTELAIAWASLPTGVDPITWSHRLGAVRGFATYLKTINPATEIPPRGIFPGPPQRPTPYVYSEEDIDRLLAGAHALQPALRAATMHTLFGLLAVTGMRIGEALGLRRGDVDLDAGVLTVTWPKSGHPRLVPLQPSTVEALGAYATRRDQLAPHAPSGAFFLSSIGTPLKYGSARAAFVQVTTTIGLRTENVRPRIHDLRHSFTIRCLLQCYRSGADVAAGMTSLSTYLGHIRPEGTYWYLSATPELMNLAAARLHTHSGGDQS
jgi:integrase